MYETRDVILKRFDEIARMMDLAPDSEAYYDFLSMYDGVESEEQTPVCNGGDVMARKKEITSLVSYGGSGNKSGCCE